MRSQWKRPLNVDIICRLRVMGWSKNSFSFDSDEGDGYEIIPGYTQGEGPTLKPLHFEEWAEQLSYAAEWCREQAQLMSGVPNTVDIQKTKAITCSVCGGELEFYFNRFWGWLLGSCLKCKSCGRKWLDRTGPR